MNSRPVHPASFLALLVALPAAGAGFGARSFKSSPIQITADGAQVWAANPDNDSVSRLDTATLTLTEFPLPAPGPHAPHGISLKEDGSEIWVACRDSDRVYVLGRDGMVLQRIDLPWGSGPYAIALSRDQKTALVTLYRAPGLALLDVAGRRLDQVVTPLHYYSPVGVAWTEDGISAWVTHLLAVEMGGDPFLSRVEAELGDLRATAKLRTLSANPKSNNALAAPYQLAEGGYLNFRGGLAQIPSNSGKNEMWILTQYGNEGNEFTPNSTAQAVIRHVDLATNALLNTNKDKVILSAVQVHDPIAANNPYVGPGWDAHAAGPIDIAFSADGQTAWVLDELSRNVIVLPTNTPAANLTGAPPLTEIRVGSRPIGLAVSPTANRGYVINQLSRSISVLDLTAGSEIRQIPSTPITGEPYSPSVLLGAKIFHSSVDPDGKGRISANEKVACATCHPGGEHDGRHWNFNNLPGKHGVRRTMSLLGIGQTFSPGQRDPLNNVWGQIHRSGDRDEIQDFEHSFQSPLMGGTGFLGAAVNPELGPPNAGRSVELDALADYVMQLPPPRRSPFRAASGALSEAAVRGATYFQGANYPTRKADAACATCHVPTTGFVDHTSHDVGQMRGSNETELNSRTPAWTVNTQSLLGAWATPPYEGGSSFGFNDIVDLIRDQASQTKHGTPQGLTGRQIQDLADFVRSIDGDLDGTLVASLRDTTPPRIVKVEVVSLTRLNVWLNETVDAVTAGNAASYRLTDLASGQPVAITGAQRDAQNGDLVRLTTALPASCGTFRLAPAPGVPTILDVASTVSGGTANAMVAADPANSHDFALPSTITLTLGGSGYESITVPVHDVTIASGVNMDGVWLWGGARGFVRLDWRDAFTAATGITNPADILEASFSLDGDWGDVKQRLELRRVLLSWSDPAAGGDWDSNPVGGPSWSSHIHPSTPWNAAGATRRTAGIDGKALGDYDSTNDTAFTPDLVITPTTLSGRTSFAGPAITDAFRFWLDPTHKDYGYVFDQNPVGANDTRFRRSEEQLHEHGPVLTITYKLPVAGPALPGEVSAPSTPAPLLAVKQGASDVLLRFEDLGASATSYNVYEGTIGRWFSHTGTACNSPAPLVAGRREARYSPLAGSRYFQVTAASACGEGPAAAGWPMARLDCLP